MVTSGQAVLFESLRAFESAARSWIGIDAGLRAQSCDQGAATINSELDLGDSA